MSEQLESVTLAQALQRARQFMAADRLNDATAIYQHILIADPGHQQALLQLAHIALQGEHYSSALTLCQRLLQLNSEHALAHSLQAQALARQGQAQAAITAYRRALSIDGDLPEVHYALGLLQCKLGQVRAGVSELEKAATQRPVYFAAHINLGIARAQLGQLEAALVCHQQALALQPDSGVAQGNIAQAYRSLGRLDEAAKAYQRLLTLQVNDANAYNELGNIRRSQDRLEQAQDHYQQALLIDENFAMAWRNQGSVLQQLGKLEQARSCFERANTALAKADWLECLYQLDDQAGFDRALAAISAEDKINVGVAAISAFAANQYQRLDPYPFCPQPMAMIEASSLLAAELLLAAEPLLDTGPLLDAELTAETNSEPLIPALKKQLTALQVGGGQQALLTEGFQSASCLFVDASGALARLQGLLESHIARYRDKHQHSECLYIRRWPARFGLRAWYVDMRSGGKLSVHNHSNGWLSGVVYLQVPENNAAEGNIEFGLHGPGLGLKKEHCPSEVYPVATGDLLLFPSSLFHRTLAFSGSERRLCIAFDVVPQ